MPGTFGQVLECWDQEKKEYVAIKVVRNVPKYRAAAVIEIDVLRTLANHDKAGKRGAYNLRIGLITEIMCALFVRSLD